MKKTMMNTMALAAASLLLATATSWGQLRISEICPEPTRSVSVTNHLGHNETIVTTGHEPVLDPNGKASGWIELLNTGKAPVDLKDYKIVCKERGKKLKISSMGNLCTRKVPAGGRTLVYIGGEYDNAKDDGKEVRVYGDVMALPVAVKPRNFPIVVLAKGDGTVVDRFIIPVDLPEGASFAPGKAPVPGYVARAILPHPTPGARNDYAGAIPYGPNAGPLYGVKHKLSDLEPRPPARPGIGYKITMPVNPLSDHPANRLKGVTLLYRTMVDEPGYKDQSTSHDPDYKGQTFVTHTIPMEKIATDPSAGTIWGATIPGDDLPAPGKLLQWAFLIEDNAKRKWRSPSFHDPDRAYEWYGTITEPTAAATSKTLQTFHLFAENRMLEKGAAPGGRKLPAPIDRQHETVEADETLRLPYGARCSIYDEQTSTYYDNVKIDVRGNTTGALIKKSHAVRFNRCHPMSCTNPFTGERLKKIRKTTFIAEYCDPTTIRQALSFNLWRACGNPVPFGYPVKLTMNGRFYQLAHHSNPFSDELIGNYYGFKEEDGTVGYGYKNCSQLLASDVVNPQGGVAGPIEQKTPDGDLENGRALLKAFVDKLNKGNGSEKENPDLTRTVARDFDLPAWLNYLATARITQEADDIWANLCLYYDSVRSGTWMPLGYDQNLSFGQYYPEGVASKPPKGTIANWDNHKSHPFYGGWRVLHQGCLKPRGNYGFEAVYQSPKFRRLYLRRLRTLMDQVLKEPGTPPDRTPFWTEIVLPMKNAIAGTAAEDDKLWGDGNWEVITVWEPQLSFEKGFEDLWKNYVVPRRIHLFKTHSVHNKAKGVGYGWNLSAGIPDAQRPVSALKGKIRFLSTGGDDVIMIRNDNDEAVDMSGWKLEGAWTQPWTFRPGAFDILDKTDWKWKERCSLPPGTVVDGHDVLYIAFDRRGLVEKLDQEGKLKDQVIIGNIPRPDSDAGKPMTLWAPKDSASQKFELIASGKRTADRP